MEQRDADRSGMVLTAALLGSLPVTFLYSFFVEHYVARLMAGSVKV